MAGQLRALRDEAMGLAVRAGLRPYRPMATVAPAGWDAGYARGEWDRMARVAEAGRYALLLGYLKLAGKAPSVLDVGCGPGLLREKMAGAGFRSYTGVDVSPAAIEAAKAFEDERTEFVVGDVSAVAGRSFDVAVCNEMLYYVGDPPAFLAELRRLLPPGGHLLTSVWRHPGDSRLHAMLDSAFDLVDRVELRNGASRRLRWRVAWHRAGLTPPAVVGAGPATARTQTTGSSPPGPT